MKKYLLIIFLFVALIIMNKFNETRVVNTFIETDNKYYDTYTIDMNDMSLSRYKEIFFNIDYSLYFIKDIKLTNNYNDFILKDISKIKIEENNYITSLNEYIDKCIIILDKYNLDDEISKFRNGNFKIDKIVIYTTEEVYNLIIENVNS